MLDDDFKTNLCFFVNCRDHFLTLNRGLIQAIYQILGFKPVLEFPWLLGRVLSFYKFEKNSILGYPVSLP